MSRALAAFNRAAFVAGDGRVDETVATVRATFARLRAALIASADRRAALGLLTMMAVLEATIFPAPTEALLVAMALARRDRAWTFGAIATLASVGGGLLGYEGGRLLGDAFASPTAASAGHPARLAGLAAAYRDNAFLALATSGYTPVPYLLYTAVAGAVGIPMPVFVVGSLVGRALKYLPIVGLVYLLGPPATRVLARHAVPLAIGIGVIAALGWLVTR